MSPGQGDYKRPTFGYTRSADQDIATTAHHPVIIVGAGLVGLTLAVDLKLQGVPVILLEKRDTLSDGSRSICQSKRTLEIWDRLGVAEQIVQRGITWNTGRIFLRDQMLYAFDLLPEAGHKMPAFVNLQQYLVEAALVERFTELGGEIRWRHELITIEASEDHVTATILTPDGFYHLTSAWLVSAEGARGIVREQLGLNYAGQVFEDKFLIADVKMTGDFPSERWFWFEPPFHDGQTALLHRQADDVWRIDLQLGWDADVKAEQEPERVRARIQKMLGADANFDLEWISVYVFQCRTLERYVHGRVIFMGDAAHQVSPFGARGGNGGVQDADNLGWKLKRVLDGTAPPELLESYSLERLYAARENILHSTRATDFITPKTAASKVLRDTVLELAQAQPFARALVNSGRLSVPAHLQESALNTADEDQFDTVISPGSPAPEAPIMVDGKPGWLLEQLGGEFALLYAATIEDSADAIGPDAGGCRLVVVDPEGSDVRQGELGRRYDLKPGTAYLFRPDQHVVARWRALDGSKLRASLARAQAKRVSEV